MSVPEQRDSPVSTVAGYLAAASMFAAAASLVYYPGRIGPGAMLIALLAAALGGVQRRLAGLAVAIAGLCWFFGMVIAVVLERPIF